MYRIMLDDNTIYYPNDDKAVLDDITLNLELNTAGTLTFTCPSQNPCYELIKNRKSIVSVWRDDEEIFFGEVREQVKDLYGSKKVTCVGLLTYLADSIQPQKEYHDQSSYQLLEKLLQAHNSQVDDYKKIRIGFVTVSDSNDSLYRFTNFETTLEAIMGKMVEKLGGYVRLRKEDGKLYLDYLRLEEMGKATSQHISFGLNLLEYAENLSAEDVTTAVIPLGKELENENSENEVLKKHVDITSINNGKNYIVSREAQKTFGWVCKVINFNNVTVPTNLMRKATKWLQDNQFEHVEISLRAVDLSELGLYYATIECGDRVRCLAPQFGMDRVFPVVKKTIPIQKPGEMRIVLASRISKGYVQNVSHAVQTLKEETVEARKIDNERVKAAIDNIKAQMGNSQSGYKISEYDSKGMWVRDLYMDTPDKNTATKVLQVNMNGIAGSHNGFSGPYSTAMTLDGMVYGDRIIGHSIDAEKLSVSYTSQVEKQISKAKNEAIKDTGRRLENYYTISEINTKLNVTDGKIEAGVESVNHSLKQKNGNYYGSYTPSHFNAPMSLWLTDSEKMQHVGDFFYDTSTGYAYRLIVKQESLAVKFNEKSHTESAFDDFVDIFYKYKDKIYAIPGLTGEKISGATVFVPSNEFWLHFRTNWSPFDNYGFKIDSIKKEYSGEISGYVSKLPEDINIIEVEGENYPESEHPYKGGTSKLWHYVSADSISSFRTFAWIRVKDKDIEAAKSTADKAISKLTIVEDSISSMVKKGDFGSFMQQNYNSFLLGFNHSSKYVQITPGQIELYDGEVDEDHKRAVFDKNGNNFYRNGVYIGYVGTGEWEEDNSHKGLVFHLTNDGKYMAFAQRKTADEETYATMLCFSRSQSIYKEYGIHAGCNFYMHGNKIIDPIWEDGAGVDADINYVQIIEMNQDGKASKWGSNAHMVFKNGILMKVKYY